MPNNYFQFKKFTIWQDNCAMKVCTDACLFGALLSSNTSIKLSPRRVLDIGTGTGLLALMYAQQQGTAIIDAVEVDEATSMQAKQNFETSPWRDRLNVYHTAIQDFNPETHYDFILSNPPFFENDLKSDDNKRNIALHSTALALDELLACINRLLGNKGAFAILLPYHRSEYFERLALEAGFYLTKRIFIKQTITHNYFRAILYFSREESPVYEEAIAIQESANEYTAAFTALLKDYYLKL